MNNYCSLYSNKSFFKGFFCMRVVGVLQDIDQNFWIVVKLIFDVSVKSCFVFRKILMQNWNVKDNPNAVGKSGHAIFFSFFSDASESKILAFTFERFRLYRLNSVWHQFLKSKFVKENSLRPKKFLFEMTIFHNRSQ